MTWEETHLGTLRRRVRTVTRLGRLRGVLIALAAGTAAAGGAFLVESALDISLWLPPWVRLGTLAGTAVLAVYAALRWGVRSTRELGREPEAARAVEHRYPAIENTLSTAIEFGSDPVKTEAYSSPALVDRLVEVTDGRTAPLSFPRAVDWRALARASALAAALAVLVLVYAAALPQLAGATAARFFAPLGETPPPTWTVIEKLAPGTTEVQRGSSQRIEVTLGGRRPGSVRLVYRVAGGPDIADRQGEAEPEWSEVEMSPLSERSFTRTLVNITRPIEYRVSAGDAASPKHTLTPFEEPRLRALRLRITPPAYTGLPAEDLPEGTGDVRAVVGTTVEVRARVSAGTTEATLELRLRDPGSEPKAPSAVVLEPEESDGADPRDRRASFRLTHDGEYRILLRDGRGRTNRSEEDVIFRLSAVPDRKPKVRVTAPRPDVLAARDQEVTIEIEASDDWGLAEVGIVHTLSGSPKRVGVERPAPGTKKSSPSHGIKLGLFGFKGGEIVTYHAYARDNNDVTGPSEAEGELRFIRTYGEERYGMQMAGMTVPPAAREVDRLIERQIKVMRQTFDLARRGRDHQTDRTARRGRDHTSGRGADEAASAQEDVRRDLEELLRTIETELDREALRGILPREIVFLREAEEKMGEATEKLLRGRTPEATGPQAEALSYLSKTRRIILSQSGSDGVGRAMEDARRQRESHRQAERRRNLDELEREMRKMPPILEREEKARRKLERLEDEPPPPGAAGQAAEEQRRLAESVREQAQRMGELGANDESFPQEPRRRLLEAAEEMELSADAAAGREFSRAAEAAKRAERGLSEAEGAARSALRSKDRERTNAAEMQAEELARKQKELRRRTAEKARERPEGQETGMSAQEAGSLAREQEELREELGNLREEIDSLAGRAEREGKPEADRLQAGLFREEMAEEEMDRAARSLRGARPNEAQEAQREAAKQLGRLADDLREARRLAESDERRELTRAVERAEDLAREAGRLSRDVRDPAQDPKGLTGEAERLQEEAAGIAGAVSLIPSRAGKGDIEKAKESLERAERELARASRAMGRPDRAGAAGSLEGARREAEHAASALRRSAAQDVARALSDARAEAERAARKQEEVRDDLAARSGGQEDDGVPAPSEKAVRRQGEAAAAEGRARENVETAAETARGLDSNVAGLLEREAGRWERERLDERMGDLASRLERERELDAPAPDEAGEEAAAEDVRLSAGLARDAAAAARRLRSLFAEARDDEIESLRALAEDSRRLAGDLRSLEEAAASLAREDAEPDGRPSEARPGRDHLADRTARRAAGEAGLRELTARVRGLEDDAKGLRERLERRAPEILSQESGDAQVADRLRSTERELLELGRRLSRNQPPRPTNVLGTGALAYQLVGDGVIEKLERLVKLRKLRPPEDEIAPEEFRELVEKYFRALSEDGGE